MRCAGKVQKMRFSRQTPIKCRHRQFFCKCASGLECVCAQCSSWWQHHDAPSTKQKKKNKKIKMLPMIAACLGAGSNWQYSHTISYKYQWLTRTMRLLLLLLLLPACLAELIPCWLPIFHTSFGRVDWAPLLRAAMHHALALSSFRKMCHNKYSNARHTPHH